MIRIFIFITIFINGTFDVYAQFNYGLKLSSGMSFIQNPKGELEKTAYYNFDIESYQYAHDVAAFVQYRYKKVTFKGDVGHWKANFTTYSNVKPPDVDDGGWLTYPPELYPVYFKTDRRFRYYSLGLGASYQVHNKWNVGFALSYLFNNEKYMTTSIFGIIPTPEVLGLTGKNDWVGGGNYAFARRLNVLKLNTNYQVSPYFSLLLEYQRNIKSVSTLHDYYFNIFNIGLNFTIRPTKPYQKDEIIYY